MYWLFIREITREKNAMRLDVRFRMLVCKSVSISFAVVVDHVVTFASAAADSVFVAFFDVARYWCCYRCCSAVVVTTESQESS